MKKNVPIYDPRLRVNTEAGTMLPMDYINPPDGPHGPILVATLFGPRTTNMTVAEADEYHVRRVAKGEPWFVTSICSNLTFDKKSSL